MRPEVIQDQKQSLKRMNNSRKVKKCDSIIYILLPEVAWLSDAPHNNNKFKAIKQNFVKKNGEPLIQKKYGIISQHVF